LWAFVRVSQAHCVCVDCAGTALLAVGVFALWMRVDELTTDEQ
jgi:hypothetical protein